ncbi:NADAR family protein [Clostridium perfringens]|uniref:NADAR family protein n=1 Tax=Clostridium perfringens TaxID=1502 RepID=UPI0024BC1A7A|nr:NADAR family protein [Clostridium perfringens]
MIKEFRGKYYFLSNFYDFPVKYKGIEYLNNEAAFQAQKVLNDRQKEYFSHLKPSEAKRKGRRVKLRSDWEEIKDDIMYGIVLAKFTQDAKLMRMLLETGDEYLEEGNTWNDTYWGVCRGRGKNKLGKILMRVRNEIREGKFKEE